NWVSEVPADHRAFARALIDLGTADIVHGHSSHHPLPIEVYRGKLILYGCGDLINDYEGIGLHDGQRSDVGCLYLATLQAGSGQLVALNIVPMQLRRFRLAHADASARRWVSHQLDRADRWPGTRLDDQADGSWQLRWSDT
ncbi:MAG: CapA family protein, partial [Pseudomonadota bacterium]